MAFSRGEAGRTESPLSSINFDRMLKDKLVKTRQKMKEYGLGAVICLTDINIAYTTNMPPMSATSVGIGGNRYSILPLDGDPIGFEESDTVFHLKQQMPDLKMEFAIPPFGGPFQASAAEAQDYLLDSFSEQVAAVLKDLKIGGEKIGIDFDSPRIIRALQKQGLNVTPEAAPALLEARSVKTPEEVECVRALASIIDGCFATMARNLRPGITERQLYAKCVAYAIEQGATKDGGYMVSGPHTWPKDVSRECSDRRIRPGDVVYADFFNFGFFGYKSCYYRTFSVGRPSKEVKETYARVWKWLEDGEKMLRPGATTKDVVEKWPDETKIWANRPPFVTNEKKNLATFFNNMGHSIGLHIYEKPFFWRPTSIRWPQKIEANMTIALETQDGTPDNKAGVRIEDMIVITDSGYEVISRWPREEITEVPLL